MFANSCVYSVDLGRIRRISARSWSNFVEINPLFLVRNWPLFRQHMQTIRCPAINKCAFGPGGAPGGADTSKLRSVYIFACASRLAVDMVTGQDLAPCPLMLATCGSNSAPFGRRWLHIRASSAKSLPIGPTLQRFRPNSGGWSEYWLKYCQSLGCCQLCRDCGSC